MMQSLFRNPLADPGLVGVSSGAALGAVVAIVLGGSAFGAAFDGLGMALVPIFALFGGLCATLVLYGISTHRGTTSTATLLLAGIAIGALTGACVSLLICIADDAQLRDVTFMLMGGLGGATWQQVYVASPLSSASCCLYPSLPADWMRWFWERGKHDIWAFRCNG